MALPKIKPVNSNLLAIYIKSKIYSPVITGSGCGGLP